MEKISGIYRIVCTMNGNYYYGSAQNLSYRWTRHKRALQQNKHINPHLQNTWNRYGESNFSFELIESVSNEKLLEVEDAYLKEHVGTPHCMNIAKDAHSPTRGRKMKSPSNETKQKIRNSLLGHTVSDKTRKKIGVAFKGKQTGPCSEERRNNIAKARRPNGFPLVKSPDGTVYEIGILTDFCNQHNLYLPAMSYLLNGKSKTHRNWMLV